MKFGLRLTLALVLPLVVLAAAFGYVYGQRSRDQLREELAREARAIALVVQISVEDYLRDRQLADLHEMVDRISGYERVLGLRIFGADGALIYQSQSLGAYPFRHSDVLNRVLRDRKPAEMRRRVGDQPVVGIIFPLSDPQGNLAGAVQVLQLESFIEQDARASRDFVILLTLAMVLATAFIVLLVTRISVAAPIRGLVRSFREVGAGSLPTRVPVRSRDELGLLAAEFNGMCERLEAAQVSLAAEQERRRAVESRLQSAERLAGLGRLATGLAHEIGTPLGVISGRAESLMRAIEGNAAAERSLGIISSQIDRIVRIVRDMLDFARQKHPRRTPTDVQAVVREVLELMESRLERSRVRVECARAEPLPPVSADRDQLQQVFLNLTVNAVDAMPAGGTLRVRVAPHTAFHPGRPGPARPWIAIEFEDSGSGISVEDRGRVFDPFFSTKEAGRGTGLGLSVSYGIVEEHGGWFDLESEPGRGTRITVHLPVEPVPAAASGSAT